LLAKVLKAKLLGDDKLLTTITDFFGQHGFKIVSAADILTDLCQKRGLVGSVKVKDGDIKSVKVVEDFLDNISSFDVGQSAVILNKQIIALEGFEGTDNMIKRCGEFLSDKKGAILVKMPKKGQNDKIDMPVIGVDTIEALKVNNFAGVAIKADGVMIIDKDLVVKKADEYGIFIIAC
jgi:DUF1009 family protein